LIASSEGKIQSPIYRVYLKYFETFQDWISHIKLRKKIIINILPQTVFEVQSLQHINLHPLLFFFYLWGKLKTLVHSVKFENKVTLHQRIFFLRLSNRSPTPRYIWKCATGHVQTCSCVHWYVWTTFCASFVTW